MIQFAILSLEEDTGFSQGLFRIRVPGPPWCGAALDSIICCLQQMHCPSLQWRSLSGDHCVGWGCSRVRGGCGSQMYKGGKQEWVELVYFLHSSAAGCGPAMDLEWLLEFHSSCQWMRQRVFLSYSPHPPTHPHHHHLQALENKKTNQQKIKTGQRWLTWSHQWRKSHIILFSNGCFKAGSRVGVISGKKKVKKTWADALLNNYF